MIADRADVLACRWTIENCLRRGEVLFFLLLAGDDKFGIGKTFASKTRTSLLDKIDNIAGRGTVNFLISACWFIEQMVPEGHNPIIVSPINISSDDVFGRLLKVSLVTPSSNC